MMKKELLTSFLLLFLFIACGKNNDSDNYEEARLLFSQSAELIIDTTQKIELSNDSSAIDSLSRLYEKKITDINFSIPPETDLKLTEQENDSLFKLMVNMQRTKEDKLKKLAESLPDTIMI